MLACGEAPAGGHAAIHEAAREKLKQVEAEWRVARLRTRSSAPLHHTAMQCKGPLRQHSELEQWSRRCDVIPEVARDSTNVSQCVADSDAPRVIRVCRAAARPSFSMSARPLVDVLLTACDQGLARRGQAIQHPLHILLDEARHHECDDGLRR